MKDKAFWDRVDKSGDCWVWTGGTYPNGYGIFYFDGKLTGAHRASYAIHFGPIPSGLFVCHHCDNKRCVRPDHLFVATHHQNMADMALKQRAHAGGDHSRGVWLRRKERDGLSKYVARIKVNGKKRWLGIFNTEAEAHEAYKAALTERADEKSADYEAGFMAGAAAERERTCVWTQEGKTRFRDDLVFVDAVTTCGSAHTEEYVNVEPGIIYPVASPSFNFCPYCGGKIVVKENE